MLSDAQRTYRAMEHGLRAGDLEAVRRMFGQATEFPNVRDPLTGTHVLALAIYWSPLSLVRQLLDLGALPTYHADDGFPAAYVVLSSGRTDTLELLELLLSRGADPNARGINDYTPLHLAVAQRNRAAMERLLVCGADPSVKTRIDHCATPLEEAELTGNSEGAAILQQVLD